MHCERQPQAQHQTDQSRQVEERQHALGAQHGSPGGKPLLLEGRVVRPLCVGLVLYWIHYRGLPQEGNMNLSGLRKKKPEASSRPSITVLYSSYMSHAALLFGLPRGYPSRPCRVGEMIAACYLLTINCRCPFFSPPVIWLYYFPRHKKNTFLLTHTKAMQGLIFFVCLISLRVLADSRESTTPLSPFMLL